MDAYNKKEEESGTKIEDAPKNLLETEHDPDIMFQKFHLTLTSCRHDGLRTFLGFVELDGNLLDSFEIEGI